MPPVPDSVPGPSGGPPPPPTYPHPSSKSISGSPTETNGEDQDELQEKKRRKRERFLRILRNDKPLGLDQLHVARVFVIANHLFGAYGLYLILTGHFSWRVLLFQFIYSYLGALGTTVGAHRYWTHKSFKANLPLRILLMIMQSITVQWSIYKWCLDHRIHHKYTDTDKDPHNIRRGFWFSQLLWYVSPKHPDHLEKLRSFDMPDLERDPVVIFQAKWYGILVLIFYHALPVNLVWWLSGLPRFQVECLNCFRWVYNTHISSAVNSFAHIFGDKPFDKEISPTDNGIVSIFAVGEGWHNYHHTFPWDYKTSEFGWKINFSTVFIDFFAWLGWAYDLKTVSREMLVEKVRRSGDGSHWSSGEGHHHHHHQSGEGEGTEGAWGWGDEAISHEFRKMTQILKRTKHS